MKKKQILLLFIIILALIVRLWGITFGLPGVDHGDETEVVNHAVRFGSGDLNPHRFQYFTIHFDLIGSSATGRTAARIARPILAEHARLALAEAVRHYFARER